MEKYIYQVTDFIMEMKHENMKYDILKKLKNILVFSSYITEGKIEIYLEDFDTSEDVARHLNTKKYFVDKVLKGKTIHDTIWKPNIFFERVDEDYQYRYIVVYKEDWLSYSYIKKKNRIKKMVGQE